MGRASPPPLTLVIFDCDGVLVDSEPISNTVLAASLTAAGVPTSPEEAMREYKGRLLTEVDDRALFSADDVPRGKPFPDLFQHAAAARGATADRSAVVEDTVIGVTAAVAARMRVLAYAGDEDPAPLQAAGARTVRSLTALPAALGLD